MTKIRTADANRFFDCFGELLVHVNRIVGGFEDVTESTDILTGSPELSFRLRQMLYDSPGLIHGFVWTNPVDLDEDDLKLVASWRAFERDTFLIRRFTSEYAIFLQLIRPPKLFAVNSLRDSFIQMGVDPPEIVSAVLLPYDDRIVSDGFLEFDVLVGNTMNTAFDEDAADARARYGLIDRLPAPLEPTQTDFKNDTNEARVVARQQLDRLYHEAIRGDSNAAYQLIAYYDRAVRNGYVDSDGTVPIDEYYYNRVTNGLDTVALIEGWPFLSELLGAYEPHEDDIGSMVVAAVGNVIAYFVLRTRQTSTVDDIPVSAIEYLLACADATLESKRWIESTTVGWAIGHPELSIADEIRRAAANGHESWAAAVLRHSFHADQHLAASVLPDLTTNNRVRSMVTGYVDDLSAPSNWPAGPTGAWWQEFGYAFEWDDAVENRVRELLSP